MGPMYSAGQHSSLKMDQGMLDSITGAQEMRLKHLLPGTGGRVRSS